MRRKSDGTFLWVALVIDELRKDVSTCCTGWSVEASCEKSQSGSRLSRCCCRIVRQVSPVCISKVSDRLQSLLGRQLFKLMQNAMRLTLTYRPTIEQAPLQVYSSAITFYPQESEIKRQFWDDRLPFVKAVTGIRED
ncbi:hypothetical protein BDV38DRAFT_144908 [Aspergillus pseudotamarii]|uniref:Uncharacterized protein n=1 Tax=Aspergillus pseudotamarii TaxID=132259 RepID=A0A5N6SK54_ASPPS|nr:uncharacterized protein BDV38DRAFT_144908 [Aspergillus pseudotamarii]KAE8135078.1 hypothetical protein BDV38DRAFT_144908 [Aspergillus pseudotamarii]